MKTTLNKQKLQDLDACREGYEVFIKAHGDKTVTLTEAFNSNGWDDIWWYIGAAYYYFSSEQKRDLRLLAADYAEDVLHIFEKESPEDSRPRQAIQASRDYANGLIDDAAWDAARAAKREWQEGKLLELFAKWESA